MKNIQIEKLSNSYTIRRLTDADVSMLYAWMLRNDQYFRYCGGGTPQSNHFWCKNGFAVLREAAQERGIVLLAERRLA